jgi:phosphoenolpyruvate carboxykinase (ATP)
MDFSNLNQMLKEHPGVLHNSPRSELIKESVQNKEGVVLPCGALATWAPVKSTGRIPEDTYIVRHAESEGKIDWVTGTNNPLAPEVFDQLWTEALATIAQKEKIYVLDRLIGADLSYALPVKLITNWALSALFADNMFRPQEPGSTQSVFAQDEFVLLVLPKDKIPINKFKGLLREEQGIPSDMIVAMDFDRNLGLVYGTQYCGAVKKLMFTVHNYYLPEKGILPLHCAANEDTEGHTALFLGLSGTGKTTLSSDPARVLLGDDEHGWAVNGIANFEYGSYAKLINLNKEKEPEIYQAAFHQANYLEHGAIIENAMIYPNGEVDLNDSRLTENSRVSYPLRFLSNIKKSACGGHPKTIIFLTADASGVLPPVAKLNKDQAIFWFLMGYTSKLAGTETGITEPIPTFSRFFGEPFMPRKPDDYMRLFGEKIVKHQTAVFLINTGWTGGAYGIGSRIDIEITRKIVQAAVNGSLDNVEYTEDPRFHVFIPKTCPQVDPKILHPRNTWENQVLFEKQADKLAKAFGDYFDQAYGKSDVAEEVRRQCPGK